jgi:DNA helicase-2/ATP-dependent DNA helicase PcrA
MQMLSMQRFTDTGYFVQLMGILREAEFVDRSAVPQELFDALEAYETVLRKHCYLDFTMIMTRAIHYLKNDPIFRQKISKNIGYLIVDEYQDVNPIQEQIVRELYDLGANVCVVGDDDQTIFQWRGSHIDYIQKFTSRYSNVHSVVLDDNYRSSNAIVDVALKCISNNSHRLPKRMQAKSFQTYERGDILYNQFDSVDGENEFIIQSIRSLRGVSFTDKEGAAPRGLDFGDMVILIRKWKKAAAIIEALKEADIPFIVSGVNNLFDRDEVAAARSIYLYLAQQIDAGVVEHLWTAACPAIDRTKLSSTIKWLTKQRPTDKTYYESFVLQDIFHQFLEKAGIREDLFEDGEGQHANGYSSEEVVFYNLGMFSQIINDFETIYFRSAATYKLATFINFLRYSAEDYYPEGWLNNTYKTPNAVQIMTVYQAKGLEFPVVFVPGLNKNYLPTSQPTGKQVWHFIDRSLIKGVDRYFPHTEDERRLMYVAITRSKKFLLLSRAPDGRMQGQESVFGNEVRKSSYVFSSKDRDYSERPKLDPGISSEMANISLNFSLLKDFFDCPYRFKFYSFYGFCNPLGARMGYGSAIHNSLMELHREFLEGNPIAKAELDTLVGRHVNFPYAVEAIQKSMTEKADEAVNIYYDNNAETFPDIIFAEQEIQLDLGEGILVNGKMDLIKKRNQDGSEEKTIIDFKSTEDAQAYNATIDQLQLYALGYRELTGENADFLEIYNLDTNENFKNELNLKDLENIKTKIISAANDIRNNRLDGTCNDPKCACRFKKSKD